MSVCLYPINAKTVEPIGPIFFYGASHNPRKGLWMIELKRICLKQNLNFKNLEIHEIAKFLFVLFYNGYKEKMFTIEIEDGREAS